MREYILDFLFKQKPSLTYFKKEDHEGLFSWIWSVWLSQQDEIKSLLVIYTPISIIFAEQPTTQYLLGEVDDSFYGKLSRMVMKHDTYEEAISAQIPNLASFSAYFQWSCDAFVEIVRNRKDEINDCKLLHFGCIEAKLGIFSLLFEINKLTECIILIMGRKNYITVTGTRTQKENFFEYLFENKFDIQLEANEQ